MGGTSGHRERSGKRRDRKAMETWDKSDTEWDRGKGLVVERTGIIGELAGRTEKESLHLSVKMQITKKLTVN